MSSKRPSRRLNEFEPDIKSSLSRLVTSIADRVDEGGLYQGITNVESLRETYDVLPPTMPTNMKGLVHAVFEQVGLTTYSNAKHSIAPSALQSFRDTLKTAPYAYRTMELESDTHDVQFIEVSPGAGNILPAHHRIQTAYLSFRNLHQDEDGLLRNIALNTQTYGSRTKLPEISMITQFQTLDEAEREMLIADSALSGEAARDVLSSSLASLANHPTDGVLRAFANSVEKGRDDYRAQQAAGLVTPLASDIDTLRLDIEALFV
jgi:hypothetical protein